MTCSIAPERTFEILQPGIVVGKITDYEASWAAWEPIFENLAASGAPPHIIANAVHTYRNRYTGFIDDYLRDRVTNIDLKPFGSRPAPYRLAVADGRYVAVKARRDTDVVPNMLEQIIDQDVDCVVEFGSGLGCNLARLRAHCPGMPFTYLACEPTASGRRMTKLLFTNDPGIRLQVQPFDYTQTTLDFLRGFRKVIAFTVHSVEQVPYLGEAFYRLLLDSPITTCIHYEPIGWQRFTSLTAEVQKLRGDAALWRQHYETFVFRVTDDALPANSASWATRCNYNADLLTLVAGAASRGEVRIVGLGYDLEGINPFNPSTLIAWSR